MNNKKIFDHIYQSGNVEKQINIIWEQNRAFRSGKNSSAKPYTIILPPPNITGNLHIGHALDVTLQDILCRYKRMKQFDVLWQPGTDHAGIATQMIVEKELLKKNIVRQKIGREEFVKQIWKWKKKSSNEILNQLKRIGASCDWDKIKFTMDDDISKAVRTFFVKLYQDKLIKRKKMLVNWDPKLLTAISDLEVVQKQQKGKIWYIKYKIENQRQFLVVATTRPETLFGDTAVAVNPKDQRYQHLIGNKVILPFANRAIPIIADQYADPKQGSGIVKITPAHDFNDFEVGQRHKLPIINIFNEKAELNHNVPQEFQNLDRFKAREIIVQKLMQNDLLDKVEDIIHSIPYGDRSNVVIEPYLTDQWYVETQKLAKSAIEVVEKKQIQFVPENWTKTYMVWMKNIKPWCISRQLWWGHRIPAWYGEDGHVFVAIDEKHAYQEAAQYYQKNIQDIKLKQDPDVLDTWFSSALWPFSTMGWPDDTKQLERYYPGDVLVTGFDIIFFWVARMIMAGLYCTDKIPFKKVYIHALIRDHKGQKMSKSKGNVIDPIEIVDQFGADTLRFTLAVLSAQGRDIKIAQNTVEGYRNFVTKIWNLFRLCEINQVFTQEQKLNETQKFDYRKIKQPHNQWIIYVFNQVINDVGKHIEGFKFNLAAKTIYTVIRQSLCDWYLELAKPILAQENEISQETRETIRWVTLQTVKLLHPFMPFITEKIWQECFKQNEQKIPVPHEQKTLAPHEQKILALQEWPEKIKIRKNQKIKQVQDIIEIISEIRSLRASLNISPATYIDISLEFSHEKKRYQRQIQKLITDQKLLANGFKFLARANLRQKPPQFSQNQLKISVAEIQINLEIAGIIDLKVEKERVNKNIHKINNEIKNISDKLKQQKFLKNAPFEIVEEKRKRLKQYQQQIEKLHLTASQIENMQKQEDKRKI